MPILLVKKPLAVRSRKELKKVTPWDMPGFGRRGQAMSSSTARRSASVQAAKDLSNRRVHSASSHARPPRMALCRAGWSTIMKSMNSGTPASVALPDFSSFGMIRSTSRLTVAHS